MPPTEKTVEPHRPLTLCGTCGLCREHGDHDFGLPVTPPGTHRWDPVTAREWDPCPGCMEESS